MLKKSLILSALGIVAASASLNAHAVSTAIDTMTLSNATFCMDSPGSSGTTCQTTGAGGNVGNAVVTGVNSSYNLAGGYVGAPTAADSIIAMTFFGGPVYTYTAAGNVATANNPAGSIAGGPVFSGTFDTAAGTMSGDLSSWFAEYNGTAFNQGTPTLTGTVDGSGNFTAKWSSVINGGSFNQFVGTWTLSGQLTGATAPVPEASTYGMMLAGLGLVGAVVARRRKQA